MALWDAYPILSTVEGISFNLHTTPDREESYSTFLQIRKLRAKKDEVAW